MKLEKVPYCRHALSADIADLEDKDGCLDGQTEQLHESEHATNTPERYP